MAFRRRKKFRRSRKPRRAFKRFARRVYRAVNYKSEKKILGITESALDVTVSGYLICLNQVTQGVQKFQRIGNKIKERWLKLKFVLEEAAGSVVSDFYRVALVRGRSSQLTIGDAPTSTPTQPWDIDKWHVIFDQTKTLGASIINAADKRVIDKSFRLGGKEVMYNDSVSSQPVTNPLFLFVWTTSNSVNPKMTYDALYTYTDI